VVDAHSEHEYYPPLVPLLEAWLYLHRGLVSIDLGKTVWALVGSAFGVSLAWHLRLSLRAAWLAPYLAAGIMLGTPALLESFWTGQADLALAAWLCLAALAAYQWLRAPRRAWLVQAALFGAAAALSKFEGAPRIGIVVIALILEAALVGRRASLVPALVLAVAAAGGWLAWTLVELRQGITPNAEHLGVLQPTALGGVLLALVAVFGGLRTGSGLLVAVLAWALAGRTLLRGSLRPLTLVVVGQAAATLVAFLVGTTSPELEVRTAATRLVEQWLPLALFVGAVGLSKVHL
jgi:4-amino-4-deoxy-L-arabinose transferase-like glycosyltransferase